MKVTIGRIVHYIDHDGSEAPAIISAVHSDTLVSLYVFRLGAGAATERTSVEFIDERETAARPNSWHWPQRG